MLRKPWLLAFAGCLPVSILAGSAAMAQTFAVERMTSPAADLGTVVSGITGDTVFRIASSTGTVTKVSGTGARMTTASTRALVEVSCSRGGKTLLCNTTSANIQIGPIGTPTGRARSLTNFNVTAGTAVMTAPKAGSPISFTIGPIGEGGTKTFYVGADVAIAGNDSALASGSAATDFYVTISNVDGTGAKTGSGTIEATVVRPLTVGVTSNLSFGRISAPANANGTVTINAGTGARTVTGGLQALAAPAPTRAAFTVNGEGGQTFSVAVPASIEMRTGGGSIIVTTSSSASGAQSLSGKAGDPGTASFYVGGSYPISTTTRRGAYNGTFTVTVSYN